jgi:GNAT superfamily N-acetyltransferase
LVAAVPVASAVPEWVAVNGGQGLPSGSFAVMRVVVMRAVQPDAPAILGLRTAAELWLHERGIEQWDVGEVSLAEVQKQVSQGEWHVARAGDTVCGALRLLWSDPVVWQADDGFAVYVHGLVIDRGHAGTGLGAGLLGWAAEQGRRAGAAAVRLDCVEGNSGLRRYYARLGFRAVGRRDFRGGWRSVTLFERNLA